MYVVVTDYISVHWGLVKSTSKTLRFILYLRDASRGKFCILDSRKLLASVLILSTTL